jgi:hypothetical protein
MIEAGENALQMAGSTHPEIAFVLGATYATMTPSRKQLAIDRLDSFSRKACQREPPKQLREQCRVAEQLLQTLRP